MARPTTRSLALLLFATPALLAAAIGFAAAQELTEEWGVKRPGGEYRTYRAGNLDNCMDACRADRRCRAYVYRTGSTECSLKGTVGNKERDSNRVSGVKKSGGGSWENDYGTHRSASEACRTEVARRVGVGSQDVRLEYDDGRNSNSTFVWRAARKRGNCVANDRGRIVEFNDWGWGNASNPRPQWKQDPEGVCRREVERRVGVPRQDINLAQIEYAGGSAFIDWRGGGERGTCELNARTGDFITLQGHGNTYESYDSGRPSQDQISRGAQKCREEAATRTNTRASNVSVEFKRVKDGALVYSWMAAGQRGKCGVSEYGRVGYFERD
jgi:hypothetical protein